MSTNYKEIFEKIESSLRKNMKEYGYDMDVAFKWAKELTYSPKSDDWYFDELKFIPFYAGFKASTVNMKRDIIHNYFKDFREVAKYTEKEVETMMHDPNMIKKAVKINSVIHNAKKFVEIVEKHGSIHNFFESFKPNESIENLKLFGKHIRSPFFKYLGEVTISHFLTEIGLNALKPDRVVQRIFHRLNFIQDVKEFDKSIEIGRKIAEETKLPIRYIDIVLVVYGQREKYAICKDIKPKCDKCGVYDICKNDKKQK